MDRILKLCQGHHVSHVGWNAKTFTRSEHAVSQEQEPEKETGEEKTLLFEIGWN